MWFWALMGGVAWVAGDALFGMAMAAIGVEMAIVASTLVIFLAIFAGWINEDHWPASHADWILESIVPFLAAGLSAGLVASCFEGEFLVGLMLAAAAVLVSWFFLWLLCVIMGVSNGGQPQAETLAQVLNAPSTDDLQATFFYHKVVFGDKAMGWACFNIIWVGAAVTFIRGSQKE
jgi:hypothetical protein